jgi:hypothetical protein
VDAYDQESLYVYCIICEDELPIEDGQFPERCPHCNADYSKSWNMFLSLQTPPEPYSLALSRPALPTAD